MRFERRIAELYDEVVRAGYHNNAKYVSALLKIIQPGSSVLELGCGTGEILIPLAENGIACEGVDSSKEMIEKLRKKNKKIPVYLEDIRTHVPNKEYDYVISCSGPFSIKEEYNGKLELESYLLKTDEVLECLKKYSDSSKEGILVNKGNSKDGTKIILPGGNRYVHREIRERDLMIMVHILFEKNNKISEITHLKRRYDLDLVTAHHRSAHYRLVHHRSAHYHSKENPFYLMYS